MTDRLDTAAGLEPAAPRLFDFAPSLPGQTYMSTDPARSIPLGDVLEAARLADVAGAGTFAVYMLGDPLEGPGPTLLDVWGNTRGAAVQAFAALGRPANAGLDECELALAALDVGVARDVHYGARRVRVKRTG